MRKTKKNYRVYLQDILFAIDRIKKYTAEGKEVFFADEKTQDASASSMSDYFLPAIWP